MSKINAMVFSLLMITFSLAGCFGSDESSSTDDKEETTTDDLGDWQVYLVASSSDLPTCNSDTLGRLYYVESEEIFQVCKTSGWEIIEIIGPQGPAGQDGVNGTNGADGQDGLNGINGTNGADGIDGIDGQDGADGINGQNGISGLNSLIIATTEPAGFNCGNGGVRIDIGLDDNSDGILDASEIDTTQYICDGGSAVSTSLSFTSPPDSSYNCDAGGHSITDGLDNGDGGGTPSNGVLESGEIDSVITYCNRYVMDLIFEANEGSTGSIINYVTNVGGLGLFTLSTDDYGSEFLVSDGSPFGTNLLADICPGTCSSNPSFFAETANRVLFRADDGTHGVELWATDGTESGTELLNDFDTSGDSTFRRLGSLNGEVYFMADDYENRNNLWKTDGTASNTTMVYNFSSTGYNATSTGFGTFGYMELGGYLYFLGSNDTSYQALWRTNGSTVGTELFFDTNLGSPAYIAYSGNNATHFLFKADNGAIGQEPFISDGTESGTFLLGDLYNGTGNSWVSSTMFFDHGVYFRARDSSGYFLFEWNSTTNSTARKLFWESGMTNSYDIHSPSYITEFKNQSIFKATVDGTDNFFFINNSGELIKVFNGSMPFSLMSYKGKLGDSYLFFKARPNGGYNSGFEPWVFDGTENGTMLLVDSNLSGSGYPTDFVSSGNSIFFLSADKAYISNGTPSGTFELGNFNSTTNLGILPNGTLVVIGEKEFTGNELYGYIIKTTVYYE